MYLTSTCKRNTCCAVCDSSALGMEWIQLLCSKYYRGTLLGRLLWMLRVSGLTTNPKVKELPKIIEYGWPRYSKRIQSP